MKYSDFVKKQELIDYLKIDNKKISYNAALELLENKIKSNKSFKKRFYKDFNVSYHPAEVEYILNCTKSERTRWTEEKKLNVVDYKDFKYGMFPLYDAFQIDSIDNSKIEKWRESHKNTVKKNRESAAKKAANTRKKNNDIKKAEKLKILNEIETWNNIDPVASKIFELSYYTMWISRWAKHYQQKKDLKNKKYYYDLKKDSIMLLKKASVKYPQYFDISFYGPKKKKIKSMKLCENHYDEFELFFGYEYHTKDDILRYIKANEDEICSCPYCDYDADDQYYWLYCLKVKCDEIENTSFSFHIPYSIGNAFFEEPEKYRKVAHKEQEGIFRFGRTLKENEYIVHTEDHTLSNFKNAYQNLIEIL